MGANDPRQNSCRGNPQGTTACHDKTLVGPHGKTLAKGVSGATARPAPTKSPPPFTCSCQPNQLGRHLRGHMQLPGQLIKRLRGGMQIFVKAPPPRHPSCLPAYMALHASLAEACVEARRSGDGRDGPRSIPDKAKGHLSDALNTSCPVIRAISSQHCRPFHLLCALWRPLLPIKGGPRRPGE